MNQEVNLKILKENIRNIPDFPKAGIQFKDITTILKVPEFFTFIIDSLSENYMNRGITKVVCIESRGFILGGAIAAKIGAGFVPIRKPGKLPAASYSINYALEYGTDTLEIHKDAIVANDIILLHDDLLATGGTAMASVELLKNFGSQKIYLSFLCELDFLQGRKVLNMFEVESLIHF
jgi:adenine phosphoribosyltransferase